MATTNHTIELQAALDKAQSVKNINKDIDNIKKQIKPLEIQVKPEAKSLQGLDGIKKEMEKLFSNISSEISKALSDNVSSLMSDELKDAENATDNALGSMLNIWSGFGEAIEKVIKSDSMISGLNGLLSLISNLNSNTKETFSSLETVGLGAGLFAGLKNIGKSCASARISNVSLF